MARRASDPRNRQYTQVMPAPPTPSSSEVSEDEFEPTYQWKSHLYNLQQEAPKPKRIVCLFPTDNKPPHYGREFHGAITREEADNSLRRGGEGSYLVRESQRAPGNFTLGIRLNHTTWNFRLYYDGKHYVADKRFDSLHDLVADGLITMYVEAKAADYIKAMESEPIYEKHSRYATIRDKRVSNGAVVPPANITHQASISDQVDSRTSETECLDNVVTSASYEKAHNFKVHNFKGLNWCEYCGNFMWGLIAQGVRCTDCGLSTHKQCSKRVPSDCMPDRRLIKRVYGVDLTTLAKAHGTMRSVVVDRCIEELESRGLGIEGLYRIPGMQDDMDLCRQRFDKDGASAKISVKDFPDINVISGALKMYLRQLPIPLVPFEMYDRFMMAAKIVNATERLEALHDAMSELYNIKPAHYHTLKHLINHLNRVVQHKEQNKMSAENVGIVFGPTLLREANDQTIMDNLYLLTYQKKVVEILVENPDIMFDK
ncbi:beta-chimaerin-like isoform X2 [Acanthaster planci]|uniref:Beta-chimaerin n=1 Tax=Acanthaster planci TaxID=133434 RepID=A0A8B7YQV4_ACAPL|nr:beta-chimaerin-like isoform X2 [Acanthaster planci]